MLRHAYLVAAMIFNPACVFGTRQEPPRESKPPPPGQREQRSPPGRRVIQARNEPSADTLALKEPTRDFLLESAILQASPRSALICYEKRGPFERAALRDVLITVEPGTIDLDRSYWGFRGYDMIDTQLEGVEITGFGRITPKHDEGHAIYLNLAGSLSLSGCDIHHNGGQGLQLVNRPQESVLPPGPARGTIAVHETRFRENGFNPDRGASQVSIFGTGQAVELEDVEISAGFDDTAWPNGRTSGGLLIEPEAFDPRHPERLVWWRPVELPEGFSIPFTQGRTSLERVTIRLQKPSRPLAQIKGCKSLEVRECLFEGGTVQLDDPEKPGRSCGSITWIGNRGDALVYREGKLVGPASQDFVIEAASSSPPSASGGTED